MKKFYSLALSAAVAFAASAADVKVAPVVRQAVDEATILEMLAAPVQTPAKAPAKARPANINELAGLYNGAYYLPFEGYGDTEGTFAILPGETAATLTFIGMCDDYMDIPVSYATGLIEFPAKYPLGSYKFSDGTYDVVLTHMVIGETGLVESSSPYYLMINEDGSISSLDVNAFYLPRLEGKDSYMLGSGGGRFNISLAVDDNDQWVSKGECSFLDDGFLLPVWSDWLGARVTGYNIPQLTCDFQQNKNNPKLFRLFRPYDKVNEVITDLFVQNNVSFDYWTPADGLFYLNDCPFDGSIVLDATYPNCVQVVPGFNGAISGYIFYSSNIEYAELSAGSTPEEIAPFVEHLSYIDPAAQTAIIYNCTMAAGPMPFDAVNSVFKVENYSVSNTCTIVLPEGIKLDETGLTEIAAEQTEAPVYYNLQGVRVENPANGLYIRVQGKTATKVVL
ncbi:MAG: hypothetical protein J1E29_02005 [Duncaniella sp.]|nr:hypothetical protein [Duncaniella sp.]